MNKMVKFLVVGATVVTFVANVNAMMGSDKENQELMRVQNNLAIENQFNAYRTKTEAHHEKTTHMRRNTLIKKIVGATLVAGTAVALAADYYFNNGENTKNYVIEPAKSLLSKIGGWFSSASPLTKAAIVGSGISAV